MKQCAAVVYCDYPVDVNYCGMRITHNGKRTGIQINYKKYGIYDKFGEAKNGKPDRSLMGGLFFDEVKVKEELVWDCRSNELVGFVDDGEADRAGAPKVGAVKCCCYACGAISLLIFVFYILLSLRVLPNTISHCLSH